MSKPPAPSKEAMEAVRPDIVEFWAWQLDAFSAQQVAREREATIKDIARSIDCSHTVIRRWLAGKSKPHPALLQEDEQ